MYSLIAILMIFLNSFALVCYCRNAGNPYLNAKNKKYVRRFKWVVVVWNFAFITKFFMDTLGINNVIIYNDHTDGADFFYCVMTFASIMFTELIPYNFIMDKKIVKILTMKF